MPLWQITATTLGNIQTYHVSAAYHHDAIAAWREAHPLAQATKLAAVKLDPETRLPVKERNMA